MFLFSLGSCNHVVNIVIRWEELTVFGMLVRVLHSCSQNVAVSKIRHRLLFYPTGKDKSTEKFLKEIALGSGGRL